jgi:hypothetical protein
MHPVLEYDNCITFTELGFDWFSTGIYADPVNPNQLNLRQAIRKDVEVELLTKFKTENPAWSDPRSYAGLNRPKIAVSREFVDNFDIVFSTSVELITKNWDSIKHKSIVWRTVGPLNESLELQMKPYVQAGNVFPVRFSEQEFLTPNTNGGWAIRNFVDESVYEGWTGTESKVLTFQSYFQQRLTCKFNQEYCKLYPKIPAKLHGAYAGANHPWNLGPLSWPSQIEQYKVNRVYFYLGSPVGIVAYNYMEAMMTGCPIVTFGPEVGGIKHPTAPDQLLHEPSEFIEQGVNGFYSNSISELTKIITELLNDQDLAAKVSTEARKTAISKFSKAKSLSAWLEFFKLLKSGQLTI